MSVLFCNFLLYLGLFLFLYMRAGRRVTFLNGVVLWITFIAFMGFFSLFNGSYGEIFVTNGKFELQPYLLCFVSVLIALFPIRQYNKKVKLESLSALNLKKLNAFLYFLAVLFSILTLVYLTHALENLLSGKSLADIYNEFHETGVAGNAYGFWEGKFIRAITPFNFSFYWFVIFISVLRLNNGSKDKSYWIFLIIITASPDFFLFLTRSARGEFLYLVVKYSLTFIILWPYLRTSLKHKIIRSGTLLLVPVLIINVLISISRFDVASDEQSSTNSIIRYLGEAYPNLSNNLWGQVKFHPMGTRFFPFVLGDDFAYGASGSIGEQHVFWEKVTGVPMLNFKTIYGDFYIEFGEFGAFVAMIIVFGLLSVFFSKKRLKWDSFPMLSVYLHIITIAPLFFSFRGSYKFELFVFSLIFTIFIKYYLSKKIVNHHFSVRLFKMAIILSAIKRHPYFIQKITGRSRACIMT